MSYFEVTTVLEGTTTLTIEADSSEEARSIADDVLDLDNALDTWAERQCADADQHGHSVVVDYELDAGERWTKEVDGP